MHHISLISIMSVGNQSYTFYLLIRKRFVRIKYKTVYIVNLTVLQYTIYKINLFPERLVSIRVSIRKLLGVFFFFGEQIFKANTDSTTLVTKYLPSPIVARSVRLLPISCHSYCGLHFDVVGCEGK